MIQDKKYSFSLVVFLIACKATPSVETGTSAVEAVSLNAATRIEWVHPAEGDVAAAVKSEIEKAKSQNKKLLVYVGATWCEPCKRFHDAVESGKLDGMFANLRIVEFDRDNDYDRLRIAGYHSKYIPLFAIPNADGTSSGKQIEGSIKGEGAVMEITPKLKRLIASM